ncbi:BTAD domain-containing putative transcriptional regulator [Actinokineospora soli]|uniref:BTAD domain-containing putative transcriptional regulator n=1 Tax=Actinokineospora soli TaxID=1048753 RepID=A0ABW2TPR4_9PSEU
MIDSATTAVFRILGTVEVEGPHGRVPIPPGRQQVVLASLLLEANQVVSTEYLVDTLWDDRPPGTARTQVQICVSRLRKSLSDAGVDAPITTRPPGYLMRVDLDLVDVHLFTRQVVRARELARADQAAEAAALLRSAVGLWRGPCLSGLANRGLRTRALRLDEERLAAVEACLDLELGLGRHSQLVGEISTLVRDHPLRERLRAQLMLALYRSGRQAEALDAYREGRDLLIDELGLEPGEELRALEAAILAGEPTLVPERPAAVAEAPAPSPRPQVPRQLPADTADFVGDDTLLREAESVLVGGGRAVGVVVIVGRPGVGKSTLAAHIGHRLADEHFPDGQLYCDLRGTRAEPSAALEVLGRFLLALGIPGPVIPATLDERVEMYRTLLASKRVLVVLDDAVTESQVVPLLPGSSSCAVLVTTRTRLTGVPGARQIELDVLDPEQSLDLLGRVVGDRRVAAEPEAAAALVRTVGGLPLALRIIAARLAARPHWTLASMVHRLASERHRLDELAHGEMTIRASLSLTHDGLDKVTRRLFALLSLAEGPTLPGWLAGAAIDDDRPFPSDLLEPLVDVQMLDVAAVEPTGSSATGTRTSSGCSRASRSARPTARTRPCAGCSAAGSPSPGKRTSACTAATTPGSWGPRSAGTRPRRTPTRCSPSRWTGWTASRRTSARPSARRRGPGWTSWRGSWPSPWRRCSRRAGTSTTGRTPTTSRSRRPARRGTGAARRRCSGRWGRCTSTWAGRGVARGAGGVAGGVRRAGRPARPGAVPPGPGPADPAGR